MFYKKRKGHVTEQTGTTQRGQTIAFNLLVAALSFCAGRFNFTAPASSYSVQTKSSLREGDAATHAAVGVGNASLVAKDASAGGAPQPEQVPLYIVQFGMQRTSTTVQYQILCASLFLNLIDRPGGDGLARMMDFVHSRAI